MCSNMSRETKHKVLKCEVLGRKAAKQIYLKKLRDRVKKKKKRKNKQYRYNMSILLISINWN